MNRHVSVVLLLVVGWLTITHGELPDEKNESPSTSVVPKRFANHFEPSPTEDRHGQKHTQNQQSSSKLDLESEKIEREKESNQENVDQKHSAKRATSQWRTSYSSSRSSSSRTNSRVPSQTVQRPSVQYYQSSSSQSSSRNLQGNQNAAAEVSAVSPATAGQQWTAESSRYTGYNPYWYNYYYGSSDSQYGRGNQESDPTQVSLFSPENYQYSSSYYNSGQNQNGTDGEQYIPPGLDYSGSSADANSGNYWSGQWNSQWWSPYYNSAYWYSQARSPYNYQSRVWSNDAGSYYGGAYRTSQPQTSYYSTQSDNPYNYYNYYNNYYNMRSSNPSYSSSYSPSYTYSQTPSYSSSYSSYYSPSYAQSYSVPYSSAYTSSQAYQQPWNQQWTQQQWNRPSSFWSDNTWHGMQVGCSGASKQCLNSGQLLQPTTGQCFPLGDTRPCANGGVWALDTTTLPTGNVQGQCYQPTPCGGRGVRMAYDGQCYGQWTAQNVLCARGRVAFHPTGDRECLQPRYLSVAPPMQPQMAGTCVLPRFRQVWENSGCSSGSCEDDQEIIYDDDCGGPDCE